jgi:hypothetical protein
MIRQALSVMIRPKSGVALRFPPQSKNHPCVLALKSRSGKPLTCRADLLHRDAMKAKAQRRRKRLGFSLDAGHRAAAVTDDTQFSNTVTLVATCQRAGDRGFSPSLARLIEFH